MKRVLVGVDGSEASNKALSMAATLTAPHGAELTLAYVIAPRVYPEALPPALSQEIIESDRGEGRRIVEQGVVAARELGAKAQGRIVEGPPAMVLSDMADAENFDLVVVGSRGMGAMKRLVIGSTSDRLVHLCRRPVLVVH